MKVFASDCTFDYSWEEVSTANWRKYCPWNDKSSHVMAVDTLSRRIEPDTGILRTERLITCQQTAPQWVVSLLGGGTTSHVYEVSYVDPASKKVTMCSTNLTWSNVLSVRETVTYQPSKVDPLRKTDFSQDAKITALCGGWQKVKAKIEEASVERFRENAKRGREGFEAVLEMSRRVFGEQRELELRQQQQQQQQISISVAAAA
jgi:PRELI-like family